MTDPVKYKDDEQINYKVHLLMRINDIDSAIKSGNDGVIELANLWSSLKKDIREPIEDRVIMISEQTDVRIKMIRDRIFNNPVGAGLGKHASNSHKVQAIELQSKPINRQTTQQIKQIILDRLDEMKLLMTEDQYRGSQWRA
jgi:hypothetical protein